MPKRPRSPDALSPKLAMLPTTSAVVSPGRNRLTAPACFSTHRSPLGANSIAVAFESPSATGVSVKPVGRLASSHRLSSSSSTNRLPQTHLRRSIAGQCNREKLRGHRMSCPSPQHLFRRKPTQIAEATYMPLALPLTIDHS